jgi:hypothetical protein
MVSLEHKIPIVDLTPVSKADDHQQQAELSLLLQQQQATISALSIGISELTRHQAQRLNMSQVIYFENRLKFVPHYNGDPMELFFFLECIERLYNKFCTDDPDKHWALVQCIYYKLHGPAQMVISHKRCNEVPKIITALSNNFADNRTSQQLLADLTNPKYPINSTLLPHIVFMDTRVMIDTGSVRNYITDETVDRLKLRKFNESFSLETSTDLGTGTECVLINLRPLVNELVVIKAYIYNFSNNYGILLGIDSIMQARAVIDLNKLQFIHPKGRIPIHMNPQPKTTRLNWRV